ncbi:MAG: tetratricopeptide repeat protein [Pseudomonadota bacterium]
MRNEENHNEDMSLPDKRRLLWILRGRGKQGLAWILGGGFLAIVIWGDILLSYVANIDQLFWSKPSQQQETAIENPVREQTNISGDGISDTTNTGTITTDQTVDSRSDDGAGESRAEDGSGEGRGDDGAVEVVEIGKFRDMTRSEVKAEIRRRQDFAIDLRNKDEFEKALAEFKALQTDIVGYFGEVSVEHAELLNHFGSVYTIVRDFSSRAAIFEQSVEIRRELYGKESVKVANELVNLAGAYAGSDQLSRARQTLDEADRIFSDNGVQNQNYAVGVELRGFIEARRGHPQRAVEHYKIALSLLERITGKSSNNYVDLLNNLAYAYRDMGRCNDAKAAFEESREIVKSSSALYNNQPRQAANEALNRLNC